MDCPCWRLSQKAKTPELAEVKAEYLCWRLVAGMKSAKRRRRQYQEPDMGMLKVKIFFTAEEVKAPSEEARSLKTDTERMDWFRE